MAKNISARGSGWLALLAEVRESLAGGFGGNVGPGDGGVEVAKGDNAGLAFKLAQGGEHSAHPKKKVGGDNVRAPGFGAENISFGEFIDLAGRDFKNSDRGEINDLIEVGTEARVRRQAVHVAGNIREGEHASPQREDCAILFINNIISRHLVKQIAEKLTVPGESLAREVRKYFGDSSH